jgi:hypothetical protein
MFLTVYPICIPESKSLPMHLSGKISVTHV